MHFFAYAEGITWNYMRNWYTYYKDDLPAFASDFLLSSPAFFPLPVRKVRSWFSVCFNMYHIQTKKNHSQQVAIIFAEICAHVYGKNVLTSQHGGGSSLCTWYAYTSALKLWHLKKIKNAVMCITKCKKKKKKLIQRSAQSWKICWILENL